MKLAGPKEAQRAAGPEAMEREKPRVIGNVTRINWRIFSGNAEDVVVRGVLASAGGGKRIRAGGHNARQ